jgi:hypothetical protein
LFYFLFNKAPTITRLNGFVSIFIHKRLRYCLPFNRNDHIVLQNFLIIACYHGFLPVIMDFSNSSGLFQSKQTENMCLQPSTQHYGAELLLT